MSEVEFRPCPAPWCASDELGFLITELIDENAQSEYSFAVKCERCECTGPASNSKTLAIVAWNTRPVTATPARQETIILEAHRAEIDDLRRQLDETLAQCDKLTTEIKKEWHRATNAEYMAQAYLEMLGPKGLEVAKLWAEKGIVRVHHSWGPEIRNLTGEEIAQLLLDWEAAPGTPIADID